MQHVHCVHASALHLIRGTFFEQATALGFLHIAKARMTTSRRPLAHGQVAHGTNTEQLQCSNMLLALVAWPALLMVSAAKASTGYEGGARTVYTTPAFDKQWYAGQLPPPAFVLHSLVNAIFRRLGSCK